MKTLFHFNILKFIRQFLNSVYNCHNFSNVPYFVTKDVPSRAIWTKLIHSCLNWFCENWQTHFSLETNTFSNKINTYNLDTTTNYIYLMNLFSNSNILQLNTFKLCFNQTFFHFFCLFIFATVNCLLLSYLFFSNSLYSKMYLSGKK